MNMRFLRLLPAALLLALVLVAAGCGGGGSSSKSVPSSAVAVVGDATITKADFNTLLDGAKRTYKARKTPFPKPGTTQYKTLQDSAMQYLVQQSELEQKLKGLGLKPVSEADVDKKLTQVKKQFFGGKESTYRKQLKAQGFTEEQLKQDIRANLLSEKLYNEVTKNAKVTDADVSKYYNENKATYSQAASRDVRHILVNNKKLADTIESQLKKGGDFGKLAKKYSKDPGSAASGGKLTITKGQTVPEFDKAAFSLKKNELSKPIHTTYGWHIIQALSDVKAAKTTPLADVKETIRQSLVQKKKTDAMTKWLDGVKKDFAKSVRYQVGYVPAVTATATTTATTASTSTP
jgi:parvulin-like peptidyl-prolyl isomerase